MIYLDSAATSLWHPKEAEERMIQALHGCGNAGRGAHDAVSYTHLTLPTKA